MKQTVPAPEQEEQPRTTEQRQLAKFGTIGFDLYAAVVRSESERRYLSESKGTKP